MTYEKTTRIISARHHVIYCRCGESATEKQINEYAKAEAPAYTIANIDARSRERFNVEVNIPAKYSKEQVEAISKQVVSKVYKDNNGKVYGVYVQTRLPAPNNGSYYMVYEYGPDSSASWRENVPKDQNPGLKLDVDLSELYKFESSVKLVWSPICKLMPVAYRVKNLSISRSIIAAK